MRLLPDPLWTANGWFPLADAEAWFDQALAADLGAPPATPGVTHVTTLVDSSNTSTYTTASFTPTQGDLLFVAFLPSASLTDPATVTASANGLTFTRVNSDVRASIDTLQLWVADQAVPASPSAMTISADFGADPGTGIVLFVTAVTGITRTGTSAVKQSGANHQALGATPTVTFGAATTTTNIVLAYLFNATNPAGMTPPSSFTENADTGFATPNRGGEYAYRLSGHTSTTVTWGSTTATACGSLAVEVDVSAGGTVPVTATRSTSWNVKATATSSRATAWDVLTPATSTRATTWGVLSQTTSSRATLWDTLAAVTSSRATTWDVASALVSVTASRATTWDTLAAVTGSRATTWDVLAAVTASRATSWDVLSSRTSTRATTWDVLAAATSSRATTWDVLSARTSSRATTWNTLAGVTATRATTWDVLAAVTSSRATTWNVASSLVSVTASRATTWRVRAAVTGSRSTTWDVLSPRTSTRATTWDVLSSRTSSRATTWDVLASRTSSRATIWNVRASLTAARSTTWDVLTTVTATRATLWAVDAASGYRDVTVVSVIEVPRLVVFTAVPQRAVTFTDASRTLSLTEIPHVVTFTESPQRAVTFQEH